MTTAPRLAKSSANPLEHCNIPVRKPDINNSWFKCSASQGCCTWRGNIGTDGSHGYSSSRSARGSETSSSRRCEVCAFAARVPGHRLNFCGAQPVGTIAAPVIQSWIEERSVGFCAPLLSANLLSAEPNFYVAAPVPSPTTASRLPDPGSGRMPGFCSNGPGKPSSFAISRTAGTTSCPNSRKVVLRS